MLAMGLLLAGGAVAAEPFSCKLPFTRWSTDCQAKIFSIRPGEMVIIKVGAITDADGNTVSACPVFQVSEVNSEKVMKTLTTCGGKRSTYTNSRDSELIVKLSAEMSGWGNVEIEGTCEVSP